MKTKQLKRSEALKRLEANIAHRERCLKIVEADNDVDSVKWLKTKLTNLNRDAANLRRKLGYD